MNFADTLFEVGQQQAAIADFGKAFRSEPQATFGYRMRGPCLLSPESLDDAMRDFEPPFE